MNSAAGLVHLSMNQISRFGGRMCSIVKNFQSHTNKTLGVIQLDYEYEQQIGDVDCTDSFHYNVEFAKINGLTFDHVQRGHDLTLSMKEEISHALDNFMKNSHLTCITSNCGFMMHYQKDILDISMNLHSDINNEFYYYNVPICMSSLVLAPIILNTIQPKDKILVLTSNGGDGPHDHGLTMDVLKTLLYQHCDINPHVTSKRFIVRGCEEIEGFGKEIQNGEKININKAQKGVLKLVENVIQQEKMVNNGSIGAILVECTQMPAFSNSLKEMFPKPVFDIHSLADFYHGGRANKLLIHH